MTPHDHPEKPLNDTRYYGLTSLIAGVIGVALLVFYVYKVSNLPLGVQNRVFFIILLFSALMCSIALFGILRSKAHITYKHVGIVVELGGAAALFALIVYFGQKETVKLPEPFDLTVRVHSDDDPIINSGKITLDVDSDRRTEAIGGNGEVNFKRIPSDFAGASIKVLPQVSGYEEKWQTYQITGNVIEVNLTKVHHETFLRGTVESAPAGKTITVKVEGQDGEAQVDKYGDFKLAVSGQDGERVRIRVFVGGKLVYDDYQVLPGPVTLKLSPEPKRGASSTARPKPEHLSRKPSLEMKQPPPESPNITTEAYSTKDSAHVDAQHVGTKDETSAVRGIAAQEEPAKLPATHPPIGVLVEPGGKWNSTCDTVNAPNGTAVENHGEIISRHLAVNSPPSPCPSGERIDFLIRTSTEPNLEEVFWTPWVIAILKHEFGEQTARDFALQPNLEKKREFLKKLKESHP
jgi:hypothetical protein